MKRDMNVVRAALLAVEAEPAGWGAQDVSIEGVDPAILGWHIALLVKGGYLEGHEITAFGQDFPTYLNLRLTWEGHEFLDSIRNDRVWATVTEKAKDVGGSLPLEVLKELAVVALRAAMNLPS